jgi:hypothetical protein
MRRWMMTLAVVLSACGGAEVGESCDTESSEDECVDGAICSTDKGALVCAKVCDDDDDCADEENCNGNSGTNLKSCQKD